MPNRRRTARKLKRAINKAKAKRTQQPEKKQADADMLKLIALLGNKGQQSLDPATFLRLKEEAVARDNEIRRTKLETKETKSKNAVAEQEHKLAVAKMELEDEQRKGQYNEELIKLQEEAAGVRGEIREQQIKKEEAQHRINMNTEHVNLEALKAERDGLAREVQRLEASINHKAKGSLTPELNAILKDGNEQFRQYIASLDELEKLVVLGHETDAQKKLVENHVAELEEKKDALLNQMQRMKFTIDQNKDEIKLGEEMINRERDLRREHNELKHTLKRTTTEAARAGYTYKYDEYGNPVLEIDIRDLMPEVEPDNDDDVKYHIKRLQDMTEYLEDWVAIPLEGITWKDLILSDFKGYEQAKKELERRYKQLPDDMKLKMDGMVLDRFIDIVGNFKQTCHDSERVYEQTKKDYELNILKNDVIRNNPKPVRTKITDDDIALLREKVDEKKNEIEINKQRAKFARDRRMEYENLLNDINRLDAELRHTPREEVSEAQWNLLAQLNKRKDELERTMDVNDKQRKRVQKIEDDTADLQFKNAIDSKVAAVSPTSKKRREEEERKAIDAQVAAEQQKQLNERINATHKAEQDLRTAQLQENAVRSDKVKETQDKITQERAKQVVAEAQKQELEELQRVRKHARDKIVTLQAQQQLNAYSRSAGSNSIQDTTTMLAVVGNEMDRRTTALDQLHKTAKPFIDRFESNPEQLEAFNKHLESTGQSTYKTADAVLADIGQPSQVQYLSKFFESYDGATATTATTDDSDDMLPQD